MSSGYIRALVLCLFSSSPILHAHDFSSKTYARNAAMRRSLHDFSADNDEPSLIFAERDPCLSTLSNFQQKVRVSHTINDIPRGGSQLVEGEEEPSLILGKVRNIIRSVLESWDRKSPFAADLVRKFFGALENIMGVKFLPVVEKKKGGGGVAKKKRRKRSTLDSNTKEEQEVSNVKSSETTTTNTKKKRKGNSSMATTSQTVKPPKKPTTNSTSPKKKKQPQKINKQSHHHITTELKSTNPNHRIQRELKAFIKSPPPNLRVSVGKNIRVWIISMNGAPNTIYEGETYRLRISFPDRYPMVPPSVYFMKPTPRHEHVYTNGDICLSLLGKDWRPIMTAQSIAESILSILSSARTKQLPMDNSKVLGVKPGLPQDNW
eukprot:CAMPEP_0195527698 /NCGR_PEP_ID=MMETSP0794_2-20130614/29568_1 /TAXON_ID=515487 /ORGANISM="Stephanopyxis turris, Strain CCMP 815" /LENGTH=376 /DNA_ID=CAMNT_0040658675 /DNA_START=201 /DNA_END=1328 /DNA_ORIENTATION=-